MITVLGLTKRYGRTVAVRDLTDPLSAWAGFAVLCLYAAAALAAGGWALLRQDA